MTAEQTQEYDAALVVLLEMVWGEGYLSPGGPAEIRAVVEGVALAGKDVLDLGCGTGGITRFLAETYGPARILGIDIDAGLIARATARAGEAGCSGRLAFQTVTPGPLPFADGSSLTLDLEGYPPQRNPAAVQVRQITPGYLRAMGIPVLRGRDAVDGDSEVLLVSEEAARIYWGSDDPIGRRAALPTSQTLFRQVVGIVGDVKQRDPGEPVTPTVYFHTREPYGRKTFVIRTSVPPGTLAQAAAAVIGAIDPQQPIGQIRTMAQVLDGKLGSQRFGALVLGLFGGVALLLAAVGIYSVLSYIVRGRRREIGIRTALGAQRGDVLRLVIVEGMWPVAAGIAAGTIAALASGSVMERLVFGVSASDPLTLAAVAATLALVALAASAVPACRALRLDPVKALRAE